MKIRFSWKKLTLWLVGIFLVCGLAGGGSAALLLYWASRDLPNITRIADYNPPQATTVLARDGSVLGTIGGGAVEHLAVQEAKALWAHGGGPVRRHYDLTPGAAELGMVCGGDIDVEFEVRK